MTTIDGPEYAEESLPEAAQVQLRRIMQLRNELVELQLVAEERRVALGAREQELVRLVKESEEGEESDGNDPESV